MAADGNATAAACPTTALDVFRLIVDDWDTARALIPAECPSACDIAWGTGNPDLTGIGACASYIIQAALTILFQFPFILLYAFAPSYREHPHRRYRRRRALCRLFEKYFGVYAAVNVSVLVASVVLEAQTGQFEGYTMVFLFYLLQFMAVGACVATSTPLIVKLIEALDVAAAAATAGGGVDPDIIHGNIDNNINSPSFKNPIPAPTSAPIPQYRWKITLKKVVVVLVVYLFNTAAAIKQLFFGLSTDPDTPGRSSPYSFSRIHGQVAELCPQYADVVHFPDEWLFVVWFAVTIVMALSVVPVVVVYRHPRFIGGSSVNPPHRDAIYDNTTTVEAAEASTRKPYHPHVRRRLLQLLLALLVLLGFVMCCLLGYLVYRLQETRQGVGDLNAAIVDDDLWTFGQALALFVWVDPVSTVLVKLTKLVWGGWLGLPTRVGGLGDLLGGKKGEGEQEKGDGGDGDGGRGGYHGIAAAAGNAVGVVGGHGGSGGYGIDEENPGMGYVYAYQGQGHSGYGYHGRDQALQGEYAYQGPSYDYPTQQQYERGGYGGNTTQVQNMQQQQQYGGGPVGMSSRNENRHWGNSS